MEITKLHIENFQAHKNTIINFTSGLNVIVGATDSGKSSILRVLRKIIRDEPKGKEFISDWAKSTKLTLEFIHNNISHTLIRQITPTKNLYQLDDVQSFGGFGHTIPHEIQTLLNMQLITLETGDILDLYFSDQHDTPFMISKGSAGIRSKLLGRIAGMHILDRAIININSDIRAENVGLKYKEKERTALEYELDDFPDLWYELQLIDELRVSLKNVQNSMSFLKTVTTTYDKLQEITIESTKIISAIKQIPNIPKEYPILKNKLSILAYLTKLSANLDYLNIKIDSLIKTKPIEIIIDFQGIKNKIGELNNLKNIYLKLVKSKNDAKGINLQAIDDNLNTCTLEYNQIVADLKICPICKQTTKGKTL